MTQPVQEPTQGRVNQGLEYRTRQLFRRPSSVGADISYANYRWGTETVATGTGGNGQALELTRFNTNNLDAFGTTDTGSLPVTNTYGDRYIQFLLPGAYFVQAYMTRQSLTTSWPVDTMPFFEFPLGIQVYSQFAPIGSGHDPWTSYSVALNPGGYFQNTSSAYAWISYSKVFEFDGTTLPLYGRALFVNESGGDVNVRAFCEIMAITKPGYTASGSVF